MHVGMAAIFQNPDQARSDMDVWRDDLRLALMAESLGFESLWGWSTTSPTTPCAPTCCSI